VKKRDFHNVLYTKKFFVKIPADYNECDFFSKVGTTIVGYSAVYVIVDINIGGLAYLTQFIDT
jgi:hypothetical protein